MEYALPLMVIIVNSATLIVHAAKVARIERRIRVLMAHARLRLEDVA